MPLETHAANRLYIWNPEIVPSYNSVGVARSKKGAGSFGKKPPSFLFQHDMEPLWWVALWILLYRVKHPAALKVAKVVFTYGKVPTQ